jgi:hypothetical protein
MIRDLVRALFPLRRTRIHTSGDYSSWDRRDGLTPGARAWLNDQYPAGTADRVDAVVRAANAWTW